MTSTIPTAAMLRRRFALPVVLIASAIVISCGDDSTAGTGPPPPGDSTLQLPVRVHLLSSRLEPIGTTLGTGDVRELMGRVNEIWSQADIVWTIEGITQELAQAEDQVEALLLAGSPLTPGVIATILPRDRLFEEGWDVFLLHDIASTGGAPGVYITLMPAVVSSEVDPEGLDEPERILAHELGHSLSLLHVPCTAAGNLMAPSCDSQDRTRLSTEQIEQARRHARTGRPTKSF